LVVVLGIVELLYSVVLLTGGIALYHNKGIISLASQASFLNY